MTRERQAARAVRAVARLSRAVERVLVDVSLAQYRVLSAVDDGGDRATLLARGLALAKPTVTAAVDGLVERGYLVREPVPGDRRSSRISLTTDGRRALAEAEAAMATRLSAILDHAADPTRALGELAGLGPALDAAIAGRAASPAAATPVPGAGRR